MKTILTYTALLLAGFVLAMLLGHYAAEQILNVVPAVSKLFNGN
jgi:hypothetical protein